MVVICEDVVSIGFKVENNPLEELDGRGVPRV